MAETNTRSPRKPAPEGEKGGGGAKTEAPQPKEQSAPAGEHGHVCNVAFCPIGLALSTVQGAAPEVLEHLLKAAQEFFLAARAVMDNRAADFEDAPEEKTLERIEIS